MKDTDKIMSPLELEAERLKLEREALELDKERLAAQRIYAEAEAKLARTRRPLSFFLAAFLVIVLAFIGGVIVGFSFSEHQRDVRLRDTLSRLDSLGEEEEGTNVTLRATSRVPLSVTVIQ